MTPPHNSTGEETDVTDDHVRRIHHVGTIPATQREGESCTAAALRLALECTGRYLRTAPAEGWDRADWIVPILRRRDRHPDLRVLKACNYAKDPMTLWSGSSIHWPRRALHHDALCLRYADYARAAWPTFLDLTMGYPNMRLQVSVPGPGDLAAMSWGPWALRRYHAEVDGALTEIAQIHEITGGRVTYQVEMPVPTYLIHKAPTRLRDKVADRLGRATAEFIGASPAGSTWILHPCMADPHGKPLSVPPDAGVVVAQVNGIYAHWPRTHDLDAVHLPLGDGLHPAPHRPSYYAPLRDLDLPGDVHVSAGLAHVAASMDDQHAALAAAEAAAERGLLGVSTPCGLGRRPDAVEATMTRLVTLAEAKRPM